MTINRLLVDTPCLGFDLDLLEKNLLQMQSMADRAGKKLRPHAKTHKCSSLAKMQLKHGAIGICASKVSEAERLVQAGITQILITAPVVTPMKIRRMVSLLGKAPEMMTVIDHPQNIVLLEEELRKSRRTMGVLLDIDIGLHRTGVLPANAIAIATQILGSKHLRLKGIQAYAGHLQHIKSHSERSTKSLEALRLADPIFARLKSMSPDCEIFSGTGTGTAEIDLADSNVTEIQVGSYVCMDEEYLCIEHKKRSGQFAPALRLLSTVVSVNQRNFVTIDAGLKALYRDGGVPRVLSPRYKNLVYDWFGDEYGRLSFNSKTRSPKLGTVIELIVSHCDPTINLFDKVYLFRKNNLVGQWPIDLRGCSQ